MPLTKKQKEEFANYVHSEALETSIDWIQDHMHPNEVFEAKELYDWVSKNADPEDVFDIDELAKWAEANGFVKEA